MDGKGRAFDSIVIKWFWRTLKYSDIYLKEFESPILAAEASPGISRSTTAGGLMTRLATKPRMKCISVRLENQKGNRKTKGTFYKNCVDNGIHYMVVFGPLIEEPAASC